jgi:hypothetical protein
MNMPQGPGGPHGYPGPPSQGPYQGQPSPGLSGAPTTQFPPLQPDVKQPDLKQPDLKQAVPKAFSAIWTLGLVSIAATALGLSLKEDGRNAWHSVHAWGAVAVVGAVLTLTPALGHSMNLTRQRAWQVAACGAGALLLFWVLFVLPNVGSNTSLLTTVGVAAGVIAVWIAPGREQAADGAPPQQNVW